MSARFRRNGESRFGLKTEREAGMLRADFTLPKEKVR